MNTSFSPFNILGQPHSGSLTIGREVPLIRFRRLGSNYSTGSQMDVGSLGLVYTHVDSGSSADIVFRVSSPENYAYTSSKIFKISATGSSNEPRIGIGNFDTDDILSPLHVKGDTIIAGDFKLKGGSETVSLTKDNLKDLLRGRAISDITKNAQRGGLTSTMTANAFVNLADTNTLIKNSETGKIEIQANSTTLLVADNAAKPSLSLGASTAKVNITGSTLISGSTTISGSTFVSGAFTVTDLLTVLADYGQTGSFSVSGSTTLDGDVDANGVVNFFDLITVVNGFQASGSNAITGSLKMATTSSQGLSPYFDVEGDGASSTLKVSIGDIDNVGNGTAVIIDDNNENVTITGSLDITGNQVDFTNLPTSDPGVTGRLYKRTGTQLGFTGAASASSFVLISA